MRVGRDIRLIVHKSAANLLLCYVDHHDKAYDWAKRRKLETHPKTGAAQFVEIRETVKEVVVPDYVEAELPLTPKPAPSMKPLFAGKADDELLGYVACTRARDHLLVTGVDPASEFLDDFTKGNHGRAAVA